jgi:hypothetical protein
MGRFNLINLNEVGDKQEYRSKISNRFAASENSASKRTSAELGKLFKRIYKFQQNKFEVIMH